MTIQEKIKKKSEKFGKLASVFFKGAELCAKAYDEYIENGKKQH